MKKTPLLILLSYLFFFYSCTDKSDLHFKWTAYTDSLLNDTTKHSPRIDSLKNAVRSGNNDTVALNNLFRLGFKLKPSAMLALSEELISKSHFIKYSVGEINGLSLAGTYYYKSNNTALADSCFDEAIRLSRQTGYKPGILHPICYKGVICYLKQNYSEAKKLLNEGLDLAIQLKSKKYEALCYGMMGEILSRENDHKNAVSYYTKGVKIARELKDSSRLAYCLTGLGSDYRMQSENYEAIKYFNEALGIQEKLKEESAMTYLLNNIAILYLVQNDHSAAINYYNRAISIAEKNGDKLRIAYCYHQMADIFQYRGDFKQAIDLQQKALVIAKEKNETTLVSGILQTMANLYLEKKDTAKAFSFIHEAITLNKEYKQGLGHCYSTLANIYLAQKQHSKAIEAMLHAVQLGKETNDQNGISTTLCALGQEYLVLNQKDQALKATTEALKIAQQTNIYQNIKQAAFTLHEIYLSKSEPVKSLEMYKLFSQMKDSILNEGQLKKIAAAEYNGKEEKLKAEKAAAEKTYKAESEKKEEEIRNQKLVRNTSLIGVLLLGFLVFFILRNLQQNKKAKAIIEHQKEIVESHQKEIISSINYARRIQYTLLAHEDLLKANLKEHFVLFKPKDIVSGDFYWAAKHDNRFYLAVCDSTGHGVPGAFMSLLNIGFLSEAINEKNIAKPNEIFNYVRDRLINSVSKEGQQDGFDGILICFDHLTREITYAAANNQPVLISRHPHSSFNPQNNTNDVALMELKKDKMPVGKGEKLENFGLHIIPANEGDILYLYTDGYADQFGGEHGKKFKNKSLGKLLQSISTLPLHEQSELLNKNFEEWRGRLEQVDDILVIGIKI